MNDDILDNELGEEQPENLQAVRFAGFWIRFWAAILDSFVLIPLIALDFYNLLNLKILPLALLLSSLNAVYKPLMEYFYGATAGKMIVKIKVVNYQLQAISPEQALLRYLPWVLGVVINFLATIALFQMEGFSEITDLTAYGDLAAASPYQKWIQFAIWVMPISAFGILFNPYRQAVHDQLAKTYCIYTS